MKENIIMVNIASPQISSIPDDIAFEILKRLPAKNLCRFKTISKLWLSIITSRAFSDSHFQHSKLNPIFLFGFYSIKKDATTQQPPKFISANNLEISYKLWDKYYPYFSISPRGLICFYSGVSDGDTVQIWNPSTGERIEVNPKPPRKLQKGSAYFLGFDPVGKKHKLLSFGLDRENYVFTLDEKNWRKIITADGSSRNLSYIQRTHCFIDGVLYYLAAERVENENENELFVLVRFNVRSESFLETIHLPPVKSQLRVDNRITASIKVHRGRIHLQNEVGLPTHMFEMWVLEDVEKQKWIPIRIIPPPSPTERPLWWPYIYDLEEGRWLETQFRPDLQQKLDGLTRYDHVRHYCYVDNLESLN